MSTTDLGLPELGGLAGVPTTDTKQTAKDYKSDQEVRWCPGCGDYIVLNTMQAFLPTLGLKPENIVFISGIGCSSRFPYYLNTYGMHSIHGRAPTIATGLATTRPDLSIWVITGDGDALSIGGNHLIHALRRNININILLFNNRIYGLTKGQYSPTSEPGKTTKSTPMGSIDHPFNPLTLALGANASFTARTLDNDRTQLTNILTQAANHRGTTLTEIYQNCPIFNDGAFDPIKDPQQAQHHNIKLEHGQPITFGPDNTHAVVRNPHGGLAIAESPDPNDIVIHDEHNPDPNYAYNLAQLSTHDLTPTVTGIYRNVDRPTYDDQTRHQITQAAATNPPNLQKLLDGNDTWTIS